MKTSLLTTDAARQIFAAPIILKPQVRQMHWHMGIRLCMLYGMIGRFD